MQEIAKEKKAIWFIAGLRRDFEVEDVLDLLADDSSLKRHRGAKKARAEKNTII